MSGLEIIFIAIGLAMDATAVSITCGCTIQVKRLQNAARAAFFFGLFQAGMPVLGWLSGVALRQVIKDYDHWIAFVLLLAIGVKMIYDSFDADTGGDRFAVLSLPLLLTLSVATSIDALIVGVGFAFLQISIIMPVLIIGAITFVLSFAAFFAGNKMRHFLGRRVEILGGIILISIGVKILIEHTLLA